jgi:hypothetical protein
MPKSCAKRFAKNFQEMSFTLQPLNDAGWVLVPYIGYWVDPVTGERLYTDDELEIQKKREGK